MKEYLSATMQMSFCKLDWLDTAKHSATSIWHVMTITLPPLDGEVVDDDDVVVLCQGVRKVRADEAGPAGEAHEESMMGGGLGLSGWCWREGAFKADPGFGMGLAKAYRDRQ